MQDSSITVHQGGGVTVSGPDAMNYFRAVTLRSSMKLFAATGIIPTRGVTGPVMLRIAKEYTGKDYKGKEKYTQAIADLDTWIATMRAALPFEDNRKPT